MFAEEAQLFELWTWSFKVGVGVGVGEGVGPLIEDYAWAIINFLVSRIHDFQEAHGYFQLLL